MIISSSPSIQYKFLPTSPNPPKAKIRVSVGRKEEIVRDY